MDRSGKVADMYLYEGNLEFTVHLLAGDAMYPCITKNNVILPSEFEQKCERKGPKVNPAKTKVMKECRVQKR